VSSVPAGLSTSTSIKQGAGRHIDVIGGTHQLSLEFTSWKLGETEVGGHAECDPLRVFLRDVYVNTQLSGLSDVKEISFRSGTATGINKVANIGISSGDDSIERSIDLLERLQCLELLDVCLIGVNDCLVGVIGAHGNCPRPAEPQHSSSATPGSGSW